MESGRNGRYLSIKRLASFGFRAMIIMKIRPATAAITATDSPNWNWSSHGIPKKPSTKPNIARRAIRSKTIRSTKIFAIEEDLLISLSCEDREYARTSSPSLRGRILLAMKPMQVAAIKFEKATLFIGVNMACHLKALKYIENMIIMMLGRSQR